MSGIPTESRIFADRYIREARRLEKLHADRMSPGAGTWVEAVESLFQRMVKAGPVKGARLVKKAIDYLYDSSKRFDERSHLMIVGHCASSRTALLMFATFRIGPHPDQSVKEEGLTIVLHIVRCSRSAPSRATGIPVAYFSKHTVARLHQRGHDITENVHASNVFMFAGVLGYLVHHSPKHIDSGLSLLFSDTLLVGSLHRFTTTSSRGCPIDEAFFDVRSVLSVDELGDSKWSLLEQGRAAAGAVLAWMGDDPPSEEELAKRIPFLPRREDCYPLRQQAAARPAA
jgi:hypothetical protein